jgi:hypothetical protein
VTFILEGILCAGGYAGPGTGTTLPLGLCSSCKEDKEWDLQVHRGRKLRKAISNFYEFDLIGFLGIYVMSAHPPYDM